jgi:DNA/RNA-binding domain of Phe-tRNA-synthetase-like protein
MSVEITLAEPVAADFPAAQIWLVTATGLDNQRGWPRVDEEFAELEASLASGGFTPLDETHPAIVSWFDAYRRFGTNPKRFRPSVNALSRRAAKTGRLPRISPAVDAYNLVSVRYGLPAGAFDLASLTGPVEIRYARPGDTFTPLGEPETVEEPRVGEAVYAQGSTVLTRHWNHRDADQTKVTTGSTAAVFILERISDVVDEQTLAAARDHLVDLLSAHSTSLTTGEITRERRSLRLPAASHARP